MKQKPVSKTPEAEQMLLDFMEAREEFRMKKAAYNLMLFELKEKYQGKTVTVGDFIIRSTLVRRKGFEVEPCEYYVTRIRRRKD